MAFQNRIPEISRIDQTTRDTDFISIHELAVFDEKLKEIQQKFSDVNSGNVTGGGDVANIGQLITQIIYNMNDAVKFAADGSVLELKTTTDPITGATIPDAGPYAYDKMIDKLNEQYEKFMTLFGSDENADNWKNDLNGYKEAAIEAFKDKIQGIFGRVAEQNAIEAKEDGKKDYIISDPVKLKMNQIMRLNPDKHAFTRQVALVSPGPNVDVIVFEVGELEENSLVLNMKVQNNDLYYNYNIIVDNKTVHIVKEDHIKMADYEIVLKVYRYLDATGKGSYVFVMNTTDTNLNTSYGFELTGILVNGYNFGSSGQSPEAHMYYYGYHEVDTTVKPDYNKTYLIRNVDTTDAGEKHNFIVYEITKDTVPAYNETYYTAVTLDNGTVKYKENKYLTSFDPEETYYIRKEETSGDPNAAERYVYTEAANIREFDPDKQYFTKDVEWEHVKTFSINDDNTDGTIDPLNYNIDGEKIFENNDQKLIEGLRYSDTLQYKNIDIDCEELFGNSIDTSKAVRSRNLSRLDDGIRFYKNNNGITSVRRGPKKIDGGLMINVGTKTADLSVIPTGGCKFSTPVVHESDVDTADAARRLAEEFGYELNSNEFTAYDLYENEIDFFAILKDIKTGKGVDSFGQILEDHLSFVESFHVEFVGFIDPLLDFKICCDGVTDYEKCPHIYLNTKTDKENCILPVYKNIHHTNDRLNDFTGVNILSAATSDDIMVAIDTNCNVYYSYDGMTWRKNERASRLGLGKIECVDGYWMAYTKDAEERFVNNGTQTIVQAHIYESYDGFFTWTDVPPLFENYAGKLQVHHFTDLLNDTIKCITKDRIHVVWTKVNGMKQVCVYSEGKWILGHSEFSDVVICGIMSHWIDDTNRLTDVGALCLTTGRTVVLRFCPVTPKTDTEVFGNAGELAINTSGNMTNEHAKIIGAVEHDDRIICMYINNDAHFIFGCFENKTDNNRVGYVNIGNYIARTDRAAGGSRQTVSNNGEFIREVVDGTYEATRLPSLPSDKFRDGFIFIRPYKNNQLFSVCWGNEWPDDYQRVIDKVTSVDVVGNISTPKIFVLTGNNVFIKDFDTEVRYDRFTTPTFANVYDETEMYGNNDHRVLYIGGESIETGVYVIFTNNGIKYVKGTNTNVINNAEFASKNSLVRIADVYDKETGSNIITADSYTGPLQYDRKSGLFTENVVNPSSTSRYTSTSIGTVKHGSLNNQTQIVDWLHGVNKTYNFEIDGMLNLSHLNGNPVIGFRNTAGWVNLATGANDLAISGIDSIRCEYGFETSDGVFVVGIENTKDVVYFAPAGNPSQLAFTKIFEVETIDFFGPYDDDIIISAYDSNNKQRKYKYNKATKSVEFINITDTNHLYSFDRFMTFNGNIYVLNGSGSNNNVTKGFAQLKKTVYTGNTIGADDGYYDITMMMKLDKNIVTQNLPSLFVHGGDLFSILLNKNNNKYNFEVWVYYEPIKNFVKVTKNISPLIDAVTSVANKEVLDIQSTGNTDNFSIAIQETADATTRIFGMSDIVPNNTNFQFDKFYFDKKNNGVDLGDYAGKDGYFVPLKRHMGIATTAATHNTQVVVALPKENLIAVYDKKLEALKTLALRYRATVNNTYHYVDIDPVRFTVERVWLGGGNSNNTLFVLVSGRYPQLNLSGATVIETPVANVEKRLFTVNVNEFISAAGDTGTVYEVENGPDLTDENNVTEYIKSLNYDLLKNDLIDDDNPGTQPARSRFLGCARSVLHDNVDSMIFWNPSAMCIDIVSPINWNVDIDEDTDLSVGKTNKTYKEYKIFVDYGTDGLNPEFYTYNGESNRKEPITVTYNGITVNDGGTKYPKPLSFKRLGYNTYADVGQLPVITDIKTEVTKNDRITSFSINHNNVLNLSKDLNINMFVPMDKGALAFVNSADLRGNIGKKVYENSDNTHYVIRENATGTRDMFTTMGKRLYTKALQSSYGLFRWVNTEPNEIYAPGSRMYNMRNIYFNPKGLEKTIEIRHSSVCRISLITETSDGVFIGVVVPYNYDYSTLETYKLYRMKGVPMDDDHVIYLNSDEMYFEEVDTAEVFIRDIQDTQYGIFAIGSVGMEGYILRWNGESFYRIDNKKTVSPQLMADTSEGLFVWSSLDNNTWVWDEVSQQLVVHQWNPGAKPIDAAFPSARNSFALAQGRYETEFGPVIGMKDGFYNFNTKKKVDLPVDHYGMASWFPIRVYDKDDNYKSRDLYKIARYLHNTLHIPMNVNIKTFGSILYNGIQVPVSGLRIVSKPASSMEPLTVKFTLDKDARFTRNKKTIDALYLKKHPDGNRWMNDLNVGTITDYDPVTGEYFDHVFNITKINLVALYHQNDDPRELEFKKKYQEIMVEINQLKVGLMNALTVSEENFERFDSYARKIEHDVDAMNCESNANLSQGRNIAETLGFDVEEETGCALASEEEVLELMSDPNADRFWERWNPVRENEYMRAPEFRFEQTPKRDTSVGWHQNWWRRSINRTVVPFNDWNNEFTHNRYTEDISGLYLANWDATSPVTDDKLRSIYLGATERTGVYNAPLNGLAGKNRIYECLNPFFYLYKTTRSAQEAERQTQLNIRRAIGFNKLVKRIRELLADDTYEYTFIGDYIVVPKLPYIVGGGDTTITYTGGIPKEFYQDYDFVPMQVMGINTYHRGENQKNKLENLPTKDWTSTYQYLTAKPTYADSDEFVLERGHNIFRPYTHCPFVFNYGTMSGTGTFNVTATGTANVINGGPARRLEPGKYRFRVKYTYTGANTVPVHSLYFYALGALYKSKQRLSIVTEKNTGIAELSITLKNRVNNFAFYFKTNANVSGMVVHELDIVKIGVDEEWSDDYNDGRGLLLQSMFVLGSGNWATGIKANNYSAQKIEEMYGIQLKSVRRRLGSHTYDVPEEMSFKSTVSSSTSGYVNPHQVMNLIVDTDKINTDYSKLDYISNATNIHWFKEKMFFPGETELGHPQQSDASGEIKNSNFVWPLYSRAPQLLCKYSYEKDNRDGHREKMSWWTETFSKKGTPTNGYNIPHSMIVFVHKDGPMFWDATNTQYAYRYATLKSKVDIGFAPCIYL